MALAGYNADQSMEALPNVLNLAAAGGIDLAYASDMVTDAQSALGLSMNESAELVDKMAMASSKSNTSVAQLGEAILTIGGTAKNLAGGTTELSTALGILADNGIKGSEGGTALRNVILSLSAPTDIAAEALKELGVEVFDASGNMRPLNETFGDLQAALSSMTQGEQTQILSEIFNKEDLKSVNALLANTGARFDELSGYIDNAAGSAANMANTQLDNLTGDITLFKSALEGAQIFISDQLAPALRSFVQFGADGVSALAAAFQEGGLSGAMGVMGSLLSDLIGMITATLPDVIAAGGQLLGALIQGLVDNLPLLVESAAQIIVTLADGIAGSLPNLVPTIVDVVIQIVTSLVENADKLVEAANKIIISLAEGLVHSIPILVKAVPKLITAIVGAFSTQIVKIVDIGKNLVKGVYQGIVNMGAWLKNKVKDFFSGIVDSVKGILGIHSPSKVFAGIGKYMMEGLSNGLDNGARFAVRSARAATAAIENAATPNLQFCGYSFPNIKIPRLASGAVIPPNREFMTVLGDQKSGNNIEAPEDLIRKIVREESGGMTVDLLQAILEAVQAGHVIKVNETVLGKTTTRAINNLTRSSGKSVLLV